MGEETLLTLISGDLVATAESGKIIDAEKYSKIVGIVELQKKLEEENAKYREEVVSECEQLKKHAYDTGFQEGLEKLNGTILELAATAKKVEEEMSQKILPLAIQAAKKIVGDRLQADPKEILTGIVLQALKPVFQHHDITIYVNREDLPILEEQRNKIEEVVGKKVLISERPDIEKGGCIIETEAGIINAQLSSQFRAMENALKNFMSRGA